MKLDRVLLPIPLVLALVHFTGCSTAVEKMGIGGNVGVNAKRLTTDTYSISAQGNAFTSSSKIEESVRLKAAEVTLANGGTHFIITRTNETAHNTAKRGPITPSEVSQLESVIESEKTSTQGGSGSDTQIKVFTVADGKTPPPGALNAKDTIKLISAK